MAEDGAPGRHARHASQPTAAARQLGQPGAGAGKQRHREDQREFHPHRHVQ